MDYFKLTYYGILLMIFLVIVISYLRVKEKEKLFFSAGESDPNDNYLQGIEEKALQKYERS